jgi:hypothetical protein
VQYHRVEEVIRVADDVALDLPIVHIRILDLIHRLVVVLLCPTPLLDDDRLLSRLLVEVMFTVMTSHFRSQLLELAMVGQ